MGSHFRESIRFHDSFTTAHLDHAQSLLEHALARHGSRSLTAKNFDEVMEHMRKDPGYRHLYSAGPTLEGALRTHLGIKEPPTAQ